MSEEKPKNFLEAYNLYTRDNEAPANYHFWCSMIAVSSFLSRKCFVPQGFYTVYPNLYVILVGPSGLRKSTARGLCRDIIRSVGSVPVAAESLTREALIDTLEENPRAVTIADHEVKYHPVTALANEMSELLAQGGDRLINFLTDIWDETIFEDKTRKRGSKLIPGPYLTLLACCPTEWVQTQLQVELITGGFTRRALFIVEDELNCYNAWPVVTDAQRTAWEVLLKEGTRISEMKGQFFLTQEGLEYWTNWYDTLREKVKKVSPKMKNYYESKHTLTLKISMCLSAIFRDDMIIDTEILKQAIEALDIAEIKMEQMYEGIGSTDVKVLADDIVEIVSKRTGGPDNTPRTMMLYDLLKLMYGRIRNHEHFRDLLRILIESGRAKVIMPDPGNSKTGYIQILDEKKKTTRSVRLWETIKWKMPKEATPPDAGPAEKETPKRPSNTKTLLRANRGVKPAKEKIGTRKKGKR